MNELRRNGKRTREQLTFSDTYLVLDNLREYDFDLVSFYVTFNQYIDRRNYEEKADNSLIFANNDSLFKAFNVSRNRFYRLLKLAYECGLIDIEKGSNNRNIYILNDIVPFEPLKKCRDWESRNGQKKDNSTKLIKEDADGKKEDIDLKEKDQILDLNKGKINRKISIKKSCPKKGQVKMRIKSKTLVPKRDEELSQKGITTCPEKGQLSNITKVSDFNPQDNAKTIPNNSKGLIDLSSNISKSISQSIDNNTNINKNQRQTDENIFKELNHEYIETINNCELDYVDSNYKNTAIHAIKLLFMDIENKKIIKIGETLIPSEIVRNDMKKLNFLIIEHAINKFKEAARERQIKNVVAYLKACIYNSIHEMEIDIDAELRYQGLI